MPPDIPGALEARRRVAAQLRSLADHLVGVELDDAGWGRVEGQLATVLAELPDHRADPSPFAVLSAADPTGRISFAHHPLTVGASATFPEVHLEEGEGTVRGRLRFGPAWEGPAGTVHGGFIAATFDLGLSRVAVRELGLCVTRWLRLRYLRPTPLDRDLELEVTAGERDGRLLEVRGQILDEGRVTARAVAQFASVTARG